MTELIPRLPVRDPTLVDTGKATNSQYICIGLIDLISPITLRPNSTFYKIKATGGIHKFLRYNGRVILVFVAKDKMLRNMMPGDYIYIIKTLKPNYWTTVDCETYEKEEQRSKYEIVQSYIKTREIIKKCKESTPIGHVKGCNEFQVKRHIEFLISLGIKDFVFHTGDFFRNGDPNMILKARNLAYTIRPYARKLFLYGMGSQNRLIEFSFADYYITNTHFITAKNGKIFCGVKKIKYSGGYNTSIVLSNLREINNNLKSANKQKKLFQVEGLKWVAEQEANAPYILQQTEKKQEV